MSCLLNCLTSLDGLADQGFQQHIGRCHGNGAAVPVEFGVCDNTIFIRLQVNVQMIPAQRILIFKLVVARLQLALESRVLVMVQNNLSVKIIHSNFLCENLDYLVQTFAQRVQVGFGIVQVQAGA